MYFDFVHISHNNNNIQFHSSVFDKQSWSIIRAAILINQHPVCSFLNWLSIYEEINKTIIVIIWKTALTSRRWSVATTTCCWCCCCRLPRRTNHTLILQYYRVRNFVQKLSFLMKLNRNRLQVISIVVLWKGNEQ